MRGVLTRVLDRAGTCANTLFMLLFESPTLSSLGPVFAGQQYL
jgi:hypothetical protein